MAEDWQVKLDRKAIQELAGSNDMKKAMAFIGGAAENESKRLAPVDTGNLRRSITHEVERDNLGWFTRYGTNVRYALFQEVGTIHHPAHPFLRPVLSFLRKQLS